MKRVIDQKVKYIGVWAVALLLLFTGCSKSDPTPDPPATAKRTVLVYIVADNSLSSFATDNINTMTQAMKGESGNLIVYYDAPNAVPVLYKLESDGTRSVVKNYTEQNSCSGTVLNTVLNETKQRYPAESYGVVLWAHGKGWVPASLYLQYQKSRDESTSEMESGVSLENSIWRIPEGGVVTKTFGADEKDNEMEISDLATALASTTKLDFVLFDACFMSDVSVAYDLRNVARYMIASPAEVMGSGFPYSLIVSDFFAEPLNPQRICEHFISYYQSQSGIEQSGTVALVDLSQMEALAQSVQALFKAYPSASVNPSQVQYLELLPSHVFYDLNDYLSQVAPQSAEYAAVQTQLAKTILYKGHTDRVFSGYEQQMFACPDNRFCGLSCYLPQTVFPIYNAAYHQQAWTVATAQ